MKIMVETVARRLVEHVECSGFVMTAANRRQYAVLLVAVEDQWCLGESRRLFPRIASKRARRSSAPNPMCGTSARGDVALKHNRSHDETIRQGASLGF
jgi:hypothetical protein